MKLANSYPRMALVLWLLTVATAVAHEPQRPPNVIVILADDIGYGDLGCYGAAATKTPNLDRLAKTGRRFTDAHSTSAVCTPSRYSLLTGQYAFRHPPASGILSGVAPLAIPNDRWTLPRFLRDRGYTTGVVGKWHLGLGTNTPDFNGELDAGPRQVGFEYSFLIPATGDRVPCVFVENHRVVGLDPADPIRVSYEKPVGDEPTGAKNPELLTTKPSVGHNQTIVNGVSRIGYMSGGARARWKDEEIADVVTDKAVKFIESHRDRPFFLYFATHDAHVPRLPHPRFRTSPHGLRGAAIQEFDWSVGEVLTALDRLKIADKTLVIVTSDNGGVMDDGYQDGTANDASGHRCNGTLRGVKGQLLEGGHRVPMLARWPGHVGTGVCDRLVCHLDFPASIASIVGQPLSDEAAPDSFDLSGVILGRDNAAERPHLIHHTNGPRGALAIRHGSWKLIPAAAANQKDKAGQGPRLFNVSEDLSESRNLADREPARVQAMTQLLNDLRARPRTRP